MRPIGYAENIRVYFIKYHINDYIYFRFCKGKLKKAKIRYNANNEPFFLVENTLTYFLNEVIKL